MGFGAIPGSVWGLPLILRPEVTILLRGAQGSNGTGEGTQVPHMQNTCLNLDPDAQSLCPCGTSLLPTLTYSLHPTPAHLLGGPPGGTGRQGPGGRAAGGAGAGRRWRPWRSCPGQAPRSRAENSWLLAPLDSGCPAPAWWPPHTAQLCGVGGCLPTGRHHTTPWGPVDPAAGSAPGCRALLGWRRSRCPGSSGLRP